MFLDTMTSVEGATLEKPLFQMFDTIKKLLTNIQQTTINENRTEPNSKFNTQTRRDFEDLEKVYRNLAESDLDLFVKTYGLSESLIIKESSNEQDNIDYKLNEIRDDEQRRMMSTSELEYKASQAIIAGNTLMMTTNSYKSILNHFTKS